MNNYSVQPQTLNNNYPVTGFARFTIKKDKNGRLLETELVEINKSLKQILGLNRDDIVSQGGLNFLNQALDGFLDSNDYFKDGVINSEGKEFNYYSANLGQWYKTHARIINHDSLLLFCHKIDRHQLPGSRTGQSENGQEGTGPDRSHREEEQSQKLESIGLLAAGIAHEFNNLLAVIMVSSEMAGKELTDRISIKKELQNIITAAERSAELNRQLLAFASRQLIFPSRFDLNRGIEEGLQWINQLHDRKQAITWIPNKMPMEINIDPDQFSQILYQLVANACDALKEKSGKIVIETRVSEFSEKCTGSQFTIAAGNYATMIVSDNGCGVEKEVLPRIFEPFFSTKKFGSGLGLGLATVYGMIRQNNGFINVYSETSQGTVFRVYFPLHEEKQEKKQNHHRYKIAEGHDQDRKKETILLVEDDLMLLQMTQTILSQLGYRVMTAENANKAIALSTAWEGSIDLLISDIILTGSNGLDLCREFSRIKPEAKTLFISGYTANMLATHGLLEDNMNFLEKPFSRKILAEKIREILD